MEGPLETSTSGRATPPKLYGNENEMKYVQPRWIIGDNAPLPPSVYGPVYFKKLWFFEIQSDILMSLWLLLFLATEVQGYKFELESGT